MCRPGVSNAMFGKCLNYQSGLRYFIWAQEMPEKGHFWHTRTLISHLKYPISLYFHPNHPSNLCHVWAIDRSAGVDIGQGEAVTAFQSCPTFEDRSSIFNWEQKTCAGLRTKPL